MTHTIPEIIGALTSGTHMSEAMREQVAEIVRRLVWQPIETAPKDGTDVLLFAPLSEFEGGPLPARATIGRWATEEDCRIEIGDCGGPCHCQEYDYVEPHWLSWDGGFTPENPPTHWQPLPAPPDSAS